MYRLEPETREELLELAKKYGPHEFNEFAADIGWADWMIPFVTSPEDEFLTEAESNFLDDIEREVFYAVHPEARPAYRDYRYRYRY